METKVLSDGLMPKRCFDVVVFDSETRMCGRREAYDRTVALANSIKQIDLHLIYVKIDSTLRGNVGAVLDALIDTLDLDSVILSPSFPAQGRTVSNGYLEVGDRHLTATDFYAEVHSPIVTSHVPTLLQSASRHEVKHVGLGILTRAGLDKVLGNSIGGIAVVDASKDDDLRKIAQDYLRLKRKGYRIVAAGSAGLAGQLAPLLTRTRRPVLIISGSTTRNSQEQVKMLTEQEEVVEFVIDMNPDIATIAKDVNNFLTRGTDVLLQTTHQKMGPTTSPGIRRKYAKTIARIVGRVNCLRKMIIVGGETAHFVMETLRLHEFEVLEEVLPGAPLCSSSGLLFISKAGGFGDSRALLTLYHHLKDM
jgi:uncharacterized protein YgbK (DUF1537 family)